MARRNAKPQGIAAKHASRPDVRDALMLAAWERRLGLGYGVNAIKSPIKGTDAFAVDSGHVAMGFRWADRGAMDFEYDVCLSGDLVTNAFRFIHDAEGVTTPTLKVWKRDHPVVIEGADYGVLVAPRISEYGPRKAPEASEEAKELQELREAALAYGHGERGAAVVARLLNSAEAYARLHPKAVPA